MFERFTERARHVVVLAQEEARALHHNYIGTEHVLLGLLREEDGLAAMVLHSRGITVEEARDRVARIVGRGDAQKLTGGLIPFTARAKKVLELALREALSLRHNYIGTEHILLGLLRENEGVAARILVDFGTSDTQLRDELIGRLTGPEASEWVPPEAGRASPPGPPLGGPPAPSGGGPALRGAWRSGLDHLLARIEGEIWETLGRTPDAGDLLLILATLPGTLAFDALRERGITPDEIWATVERLRREQERSRAEVNSKLEQVGEAKDQAIESGQWEEAAKLRDEERKLLQELADAPPPPEALNEIRRRLGIPGSGPPG